jgi:hypothetical protein
MVACILHMLSPVTVFPDAGYVLTFFWDYFVVIIFFCSQSAFVMPKCYEIVCWHRC